MTFFKIIAIHASFRLTQPSSIHLRAPPLGLQFLVSTHRGRFARQRARTMGVKGAKKVSQRNKARAKQPENRGGWEGKRGAKGNSARKFQEMFVWHFLF